MSNGAKSVLFDQLSRAAELVREGNRRPEELSPLLTAFIRNDAVHITPKAVLKENGLWHVTGNFTTVEEAITAGGYDRLWGLADRPAEIPMGIQPVDEFADMVPADTLFPEGRDYVTAEEAYNSLPMVSPIAALAYGVKFPDEQRRHPLVIIWRDGLGRLWYAVLFSDAGERGLGVRRVHPGDRFGSRDQFLRSRKFAPPQSR